MSQRDPWVPRPESGSEFELKLEDATCSGCGTSRERSELRRVHGQLRCAACALKAPGAAKPPQALPIGSRPLGPPIQSHDLPACRALVDDETTAAAFLTAAVGGAIGALLGAAVWAAIAIAARMQLGWIAILVGLLAGVGVNAGAGMQRSTILQLLAAALALAGLVAAKYMALAYIVVGMAHRKGIVMSYFSSTLVSRFPKVWLDGLAPVDALWAFLAIAAAYRVTRRAS